MWYVYVLKSEKNGKLYIGMTGNLKRRLDEHNKKIGGKYTKNNGPFKLIYYEAFLNKKDATKDELFFKSGYGREVLRGKIKNCLNALK
jgi:putative endonuclease